MSRVDISENVVLTESGSIHTPVSPNMQAIADLVVSGGSKRGSQVDFQIVSTEINGYLVRYSVYVRGRHCLDLTESNEGTWRLFWYFESPEEDLKYLYFILLTE